MSDGTDFFGNVVKGAALGSALGPVGAGAGAAAAVALEIADRVGLSKWLFGDKAAETRAAVAQAVAAVTSTPDPMQQAAVLERDPEAVSQLREALARIAAQRETERDAAQLAALKAGLADIQGARQQTLDLARAGSGISWSVVVVSGVVLVAFAVMAWLVMFRQIPTGSETLAAGVLETLKLLSVTIISYWCGSSSGSAQKSATIDRIASSPPASAG